MTKSPCRHKETWWWNEEVAEAVREKKIKYGKWKRENTKEARMEYKKSRRNAKRVISSAKEKKQKEWAKDLNDSECQNEIFRTAKEMVKARQDCHENVSWSKLLGTPLHQRVLGRHCVMC